MQKPQPKVEMTIQNYGYMLRIRTYSTDAASFVQRHAPDFGSYHSPDQLDSAHVLWIDEQAFDSNEIEAFLLAMEEPEEVKTDDPR